MGAEVLVGSEERGGGKSREEDEVNGQCLGAQGTGCCEVSRAAVATLSCEQAEKLPSGPTTPGPGALEKCKVRRRPG